MAKIGLGLNKEAIDNAKETYEGPRQPFPATRAGYTKHTGLLTGLEIKQGTGANINKSWLWLQISNGACQESILVNLDPSDIAPTTPPEKVENAVKRNLDTLLRAVKVLGIASADGSGIDTDKFPTALGTPVSFGVKLGDMQANGYFKYYTSFYGKAESVIPVDVDVPLGTTGISRVDDDLPF